MELTSQFSNHHLPRESVKTIHERSITSSGSSPRTMYSITKHTCLVRIIVIKGGNKDLNTGIRG